MMNKALTYGDVINALVSLGFQPVPTTGQHLAFENAGQKAVIVLPPVDLSEPALPRHLVSVRATIVETGIMDADDFARLLESYTLAKAS